VPATLAISRSHVPDVPDMGIPYHFADAFKNEGNFPRPLRLLDLLRSPPGAKGPRKPFAECDWVSLCRALSNPPSQAAIEIALARRDLKDAIYRHSEQGSTENFAQFLRYCDAAQDPAFQAFKASIHGLAPRARDGGVANVPEIFPSHLVQRTRGGGRGSRIFGNLPTPAQPGEIGGEKMSGNFRTSHRSR
jgi:hypothetical protein